MRITLNARNAIRKEERSTCTEQLGEKRSACATRNSQKLVFFHLYAHLIGFTKITIFEVASNIAPDMYIAEYRETFTLMNWSFT